MNAVFSPPLDEIRGHVHAMWSAVAPAWSEHASSIDRRAEPLSERMLELAAPTAGERLLELAAGPGGLGLAAARRVGPDSEVVLSDIAAEMTAIAAARAQALGLGNVSTRVLDLERIDEPDASYDVVLCRDGLMFVPEPERAAAELHRVLRPGGRFALAVWGPREDNPWLGVLFDAVGAQLGMQIPPPGVPGPFSLDDPGRLAAMLAGAGFADVALEEVPVPYRADSFEEWFARSSALAGPLVQRIGSLPPAAREELTARVREAAGSYLTADGIEFPGVALVASGRRP